MTGFFSGPPLLVHILIIAMVNAFFFPIIYNWVGIHSVCLFDQRGHPLPVWDGCDLVVRQAEKISAGVWPGQDPPAWGLGACPIAVSFASMPANIP
jgi:hypothetical protein